MVSVSLFRRNALVRGWWLSALLSLAAFARLGVLDRQLISPESPLGILNLQFAASADGLNAILHAWRGLGVIDVARESLSTDFGFMAAYSVNFALGCLLVARTARVGRRMALLALCCAPLDAAENLVQLDMLAAGATPASARLNLLFVSVKFAVVCVTATYLLYACAGLVRSRYPARQ